jgi:hypothetical protein
VHLPEVLFSARKGVLAWHPLFVFGLAGLALMMRRGKECGMRNAECGIRECGMRNAECGIRESGRLESEKERQEITGRMPVPLTGIEGGGERFLGAAGLAGFAAQLWLVACWSIWWAGASFGNRFFISALPFIGLGLGRLAQTLTTRRRRIAAGVVLAVLVIWNLGLLVQYATEMIPREDWVPWTRIIRQNLVDVPRLILGKLGR